MKLKYIRHQEHGFIVWPYAKELSHDDVSSLFDSTGIISAGTVDFSDGSASCYGEANSLGVSARWGDTLAIRQQFGLRS
jgi:hypothetical protein